MSKNVRFRLDPANLAPLTERQKRQLAEIAALPDARIDKSDIAPLDRATWTRASRGQFYKPVKTSTTVRVDADVLAWLKSHGRGYQTRINAILRDAMLRAINRKA